MPLVAFNKPYGVVSQFTPEGRWQGLSDYLQLPEYRVAGRLDADSEGLLLLTDNGSLQARIAEPRHKLAKCYWAQVEGTPDAAALEHLRAGPVLNDGPTRSCEVAVLPEDIEARCLWPRNPPIRFRKSIPTAWLAITLTEGRNRQVKRMCAAVGLPVLRLVRVSVGGVQLLALNDGQPLALGQSMPVTVEQLNRIT
ncbi:pseudouridine synthase [Fluviibacter phosphoraccumulans]|uniref:pseudouridine synthase n=1 Tax=Fluviibacter phosphoraccumulans TaxID=1751046 RepID=UPI0010BAB311|nr:pseudouridine synthase [Fluviibacter phosphoraccumulans]BCA65612.1 pseudouridine synthase [Fluviibacter phosphoraccumulans]